MNRSPVTRPTDGLRESLAERPAATFPRGMTRLHLGCGRRHIPNFYHIDAQPYPEVDHVAMIGELDFIPSNSIELIYACHVLEHFGRFEIPDVLREWHRVLRPRGILRLAVPNFAACAAVYYEEGLQDGLTGLVGLVCGSQRSQFDYHKMIFDEALLTDLLCDAGFGEIRWWDWRKTEHTDVDDFSQAYLPHMDKENGRLMSLNLEGVK